jgi:hypothetical protein
VTRRWYRGDCHVHSVLSHGAELTPDQLAVEARALGLDFIASTEHNRSDGHERWQGRGLLVIAGQEVVTEHGHWLDVGGLRVVAHPHAPYPTGRFTNPYDDFDLFEVWNGAWTSDVPWQADNEAALAEWARTVHKGERRPAIGNSDAHLAGQLGTPHTVVLADDLSVPAILSGLGAGRSWIADSTAVRLSFTVHVGDREAGIGDQLEALGEPVDVHAEIAGVPAGIVTLHTRHGVEHRESLPQNGSGDVRWRAGGTGLGFVRVDVRHPDGRMAVLTNPIFVT